MWVASTALSVVLVAAAAPQSVPLGKIVVDSPPRSRIHAISSGKNGSSIPANGAVWPTAIYWTTVQIGTPPKTFPVAIDSGSGDLDVGSKGCIGCVTNAPNLAYDPSASTSSKSAFPFVFSNSYQTCDLKHPTAVCTISGRLYHEQVSLAGLGPVEVKMGAIKRQTTNFDQFHLIDGVMGFTAGGKGEVFGQLVAAGKCDNVWSLCMYEGKQSNGTLTIGGVDPSLSDGPIVYVPDSGIGFHAVKVANLKLGNESLEVGENAILDTGTNVLLLPSRVYSKVQRSMCTDSKLAFCAELWKNQCFAMTDDQIDMYPALSLELDGTSLQMTSRDYLLRGSPLAGAPDQFCLGIRDGGMAGGSGFIIGDTTMRHYYLVFDLARRKIGWGKVNKDTCGSVTGKEALLHQSDIVV
eukprot:gnl/TRDRNA2_/TRDRNA2_34401_c0_seq2.p1 gnl/TRDRNA2_/TRDRNA2_34401_c0~~gnl/TRDRNA2_/TRDRNA2_34401_c0_seq2.p1  ORF type:complete len:409 (+),score=52.38 gnl/TRDRNA2_/TRDRNA2_34401_c0_seq2:59-1285(+)